MVGEELTFTSYGRAARDVLRDVIGECKAGDPLAPVTVVTPSNYAGLSMRRLLSESPPAGRSSGGPGGSAGLLNVRFMPFARLAELLGSGHLAGERRLPLTALTRQEAIRLALAEDPGSFAVVRQHPSTIAALESSFREMDGLSERSLQELAGLPGQPGEVARLFGRFRSLTKARYSAADLAQAAAAAVETGAAALRDIGTVVLYLPRPLRGPDLRLAETLARRHRLRVIAGLSGGADVDQETRAWVTGLGLPRPVTEVGAVETGSSIQLVSVADAEEEAREVARRVGELAEAGVQLRRIGILYRQAEPYSLLIHERLDAAGIAHAIGAVTTLRHSVAGRALAKLLALEPRGFSRAGVMDWLTSAPIVGADRLPVPAVNWQRIARDAGITGGREQWLRRLRAASLRLEEKAAETERDGSERQAEGIRANARSARALRTFVDELFTALTPPAPLSWESLAGWAIELVHRYLGGLLTAGAWPAEEFAAYEAVEDVLREVRVLGSLAGGEGGPGSVAEFAATVERALERGRRRHGGFGSGVFVGSFADASGMEFDHVFLVGLVEGQVPSAVADDPLLQHAIAAGIAGLKTHDARRNSERRDFLAALASGRERTLTFPRTSTRSERSNLPSRWLLDIASSLAGHPVYTEEFLALGNSEWFTDVPSFQASLQGGRRLANAQEHALAAMLRASGDIARSPTVGAAPALQIGLEMQRQRQSGRFSAFDGNVEMHPKRTPSATQPVSPTSLERWSECPFRFLLGNILFVDETNEPDDLLRLAATERGTLIHRALEEFFTTAPEGARLHAPWDAGEHRRMQGIGTRLCDEAEAAGLTGAAVLWRADRRRLLRELDAFLDQDDAVRIAHRTVFERGELRFGGSAAPVLMELPKRTVAVRGSIDRVDRIAGTDDLLVYDYKSGKSDRYRNLEAGVATGERLQLPIYALAAQRALGASSVRSAYWFVNEDADFERVEVNLAAVAERFSETVEVISGGIGAGVFPANPGDQYSAENDDRPGGNCFFCPYDRLCATRRDEAFARKRRDPGAMAIYTQLRNPE